MPDERRIGISRSDIDKMGIFSFAQKINQRSKKQSDIYRMDCIWVENEETSKSGITNKVSYKLFLG